MKVRCISNDYLEEDLRIDYTYIVIQVHNEGYEVINDLGIKAVYNKKYFVEI